MMKYVLSLLAAFSLLAVACTRYDIHPVLTEDIPNAENRWGVYRNGFLIPEFTFNKNDDFAQSEEQATALLTERKDAVEAMLNEKYELPQRSFMHTYLYSFMILEGPLWDLALFMPVELVVRLLTANQKRGSEVFWFPTTRTGYYELFYGPSKRDNPFTAIPPLREDWSAQGSAILSEESA